MKTIWSCGSLERILGTEPYSENCYYKCSHSTLYANTSCMSHVMLKPTSISSTNDMEIYYFQTLYLHSKDFMFSVPFEYESQPFFFSSNSNYESSVQMRSSVPVITDFNSITRDAAGCSSFLPLKNINLWASHWGRPKIHNIFVFKKLRVC